jgi:hypothetical protein
MLLCFPGAVDVGDVVVESESVASGAATPAEGGAGPTEAAATASDSTGCVQL